MTRYRAIAAEIAARVRDGHLEPGTELPTVREAARIAATNPAMIARAYQYLAQHGVVVQDDRRRSRIASDAVSAAHQLLDDGRAFRLAGSDDPALQIVVAHLDPQIHIVGTRGSFPALRALARGEADGAAIHLRHRSGAYNTPFARSLLRGRCPHVLHLWRREQGLIVPPGNPLAITTPADLHGRRVARRELGAGTRVLLDQLLHDAGAVPDPTPAEFRSHLEIALAVATGVADVGLGVRAVATALDLDFVSLTWENYDVILAEAALGAAHPLVAALGEHTIRSAITDLGGYDLTTAGTIEQLDAPVTVHASPGSTSAVL
ncbi:substrate-binding domain-containing protein [Pseudonocardia alaniniphila]|uniref:GntR family transcriptional regulator n=1 Tax=Pseudonocardia alaniniphila TaxID=75291 RepID=A0ABS9TQ22_9PSEU|nr:substrate-binding domain-containing protein [Pseudonocardia alaniniphila]MCH6170647.1 GntR family transcriptional regulator [Pseudonocardia alaniniphila]